MRKNLKTVFMICLILLAGAACKKADQTGVPPPAAVTPPTPAAPAPVSVSTIDLGRSLKADKSIEEMTIVFKPADTIYASIATAGSSSSAKLDAKWSYQDGQTVNQSSQTIAPTGPARTEFHISKPDGWPAGKYKVEISLNGASAGSKDFEVAP